MKSFLNFQSGLLTFILLLIFSTRSAAVIPPWEIDELRQQQAPAFSMQELSGRELSIEALAGKVVLLNFWATWCQPCRHEMPVFEKLYNSYRDKGLVIVGVSTDSKKELVTAFLKKTPVSFPIIVDTENTISDQYKVFTFPTTFLLDRRSIVREIYLGEQEWEEKEFIDKLQKLLNEKKSQPENQL